MDWIRAVIAQYPKRAMVLGKTLFLAGSILAVGAAFARWGLVNTNAQRAEAKLPALHTLAEAYPHHPTWLVPEGSVGFGISAVLVLVGMGLSGLAEKAAKR
jgi:Ni/Fe-hydrogenase subunit HybB-like protein